MAQVSNLLYQRYRLIAMAVYIAVLVTGLADWAYSGLGPRSIVTLSNNYRFLCFVAAVLSLIALELSAVGKPDFARANQASPIAFLVRVLLFVGACLVADLAYAQLLFLPILLYTYLAVSKRLGYFLAVLGVVTLMGLKLAYPHSIQGGPPPPPPITSPNDTPTNGITNGIVANKPTNQPLPLGRLIDESMGSLIVLFFTLLLARAMSQAIQAQQKLTGLLTSLEASNQKLREYSMRVGDLAATEERNRLARDIHDSLGHHLAAINIQLEKANAYRERDPNRAYEAVSHAQRTVQDALKDVRESVSSLRQDGEPFLFEKALNDLLRRMHQSDLKLTLKQTGESSRYSKLKLMTLYRVIQEGLTNVHKHSKASQVTILLNFDRQQARLILRDNGVGFEVAAWQLIENDQTTQGLSGLQERLSLVGGTLDITSNHHQTTLTVHIPQSHSIAHSMPDSIT
ncbi:MAG: sensor histidine kinase [Leptolyngbyaceae cyanobacterium MAG.088]|nr:sensor histidine kinase [Leptolyngbyaceae cyanobacterium MAG.088]